MEIIPTPKTFSVKVISGTIIYIIDFGLKEDDLDIIIKNEDSISSIYKISFKKDDFHQLNKFFRQFDSVLEIFDFITNIPRLEEKIKIMNEENFVKLKFMLPSISAIKNIIEIELIAPKIKLKENDLILKLCEKVEKIDILEKKLNLLYKFVLIDFENFKKKNNIESNMVNDLDFVTISIGIKEKLKKSIKSAKLLYRASRDGNHTQFHSKCDGIENTVTFVKAKNGRRFGGFANKPFRSNDEWIKISDSNAFVFSLDFNECYYYYNYEGFALYGSKYYGPIWGYGHDLCLDADCFNNYKSITKQSSYNYNGRNNALSGEIYFKPEDYETYELILE